MISVFAVIMALAAGDVVWWRVVDLRLKRLRRGGLWRVLHGAFMAAQVAYAFLAAARLEYRTGLTMWAIAAYLWHVLILPPLLIYVAASYTCRLVRRRKSQRRASEPRVRGIEHNTCIEEFSNHRANRSWVSRIVRCSPQSSSCSFSRSWRCN